MDALHLVGGAPIPADIEEMIAAAEARRALLVDAADSERIPSFVTCNYRVVFRALRQLVEQRLAAGTTFCEWGSGMGVVTCMASRLGFNALGIELEPRLIDSSREFAADFAPAARFVEGSYQPDGLFTNSVDADDLGRELGFSPTDFDLIFVYPWPAEESAATRLFTEFGADRSLLLSFHGGSTVRLRRRIEARTSKRHYATPAGQGRRGQPSG